VVSPEEHANVERVLTELWLTAAFDDMEGVTPENSFVHMIQVPVDELDMDGNPVVCARDAIREMAENIQIAQG
jgi:hypothetical protein